jgi:hypothetical protein
MNNSADKRHHVQSLLMRESLVDRGVMKSTELPVVRMLPNAHVVKVGGRSILDARRNVVYPFVDAITKALADKQLILGVGGGIRTRHVFSIGIDRTDTSVLSQPFAVDANGNAYPRHTRARRRGDSAQPFWPPAALPVCRSGRASWRRKAAALVGDPPVIGAFAASHRCRWFSRQCFGCKPLPRSSGSWPVNT